MANFTRVKPAGWALNEIFTSAQANALDIDHAKSVNGDDGGSWAGAITWTGVHTFTGGLEGNVTGNLTRSGNGRDVYRQDTTTLADADADIVLNVDTYFAVTALTANRTYTLRHTGSVVPTVGQRVRIVRDDQVSNSAPFQMVIQSEDTNYEFTFNPEARGFVEFEYMGPNSWQPVAWGFANANGSHYEFDGSSDFVAGDIDNIV